MSAQAVTRALRDGKRSLIERAQIADDLLLESVFNKERVVLPKREMVVLQWIFDLLAMDQNAREEASVWNLLTICWSKCDKETREKLFQKSKFAQIVANSMDKGPLECIDQAVGVVSESSVIQFSGDQQACAFISSYYKRATNLTHLEQLVSRLILSRPKLFKGQIDLLPLFVDTPHLQAYLSTPGVDCLMFIEEKDAAKVFSAIVASSVDVQPRFQWLAKKFPSSTALLLEQMTSRLEKDLVTSLVDDQLKLARPDWSTLVLLLNMHYEPVFDQITTVLEKLKDDWNENMLTALLKKYAQSRRLTELVTDLSKSFPASSFKASKPLASSLEASLKLLSAHQLASLLENLKDDHWACLIIESLSYQSISDEVEATLIRRANTLQTAFAVKAICASAEIDIATKQKKINLAGISYVFRIKELLPETVIDEKSLLSWKPKESSDAFVARFFPLLDTMSSEFVSHVVSFVKNYSKLFEIPPLFETAQIFPQLINKAVQAADTRALLLPPMHLVGKSERHEIMRLAWAQSSFALLVRSLNVTAKPTAVEYSAKDFFKLLEKLDPSEYETATELTRLLTRNPEFSEKLKAHKLKYKTWQELAVAAALPAEPSKRDQMLKTVERNLASAKHVELSVAVLYSLSADVSKLDVSELAISQPSAAVFSVLCRQQHSWQAIAAYFIQTGSKFVTELDTYLASLNENDFHALVLAAAGGHYSLLRAASAHFNKDRKYVGVLSWVMADIQTNFSKLSEQQLLDFLKLSEYVVREQSWLINQYSLEAILKLVSRIASAELEAKITHSGELFSGLCLLLSRILLFQRYRLYGRMPLVISTLTQILTCLTKSRGKYAVSWLSPSVEHTSQFVRLIHNLCNPPQQSVRESAGKNSLTSSVAKARRYVAQHIGVLINNFVFLALQAGFETPIRAALQPAYFAMMDTVGIQDFMSVTSSLDAPGRAYLKPIYEEYKTTGKWTKD